MNKDEMIEEMADTMDMVTKLIRMNKEAKQETAIQVKYIKTPQERTRDYVYATGNRWAIENFNATH